MTWQQTIQLTDILPNTIAERAAYSSIHISFQKPKFYLVSFPKVVESGTWPDHTHFS